MQRIAFTHNMVAFLECPNITTEKLFEKVKFSKLNNLNLQKNFEFHIY